MTPWQVAAVISPPQKYLFLKTYNFLFFNNHCYGVIWGVGVSVDVGVIVVVGKANGGRLKSFTNVTSVMVLFALSHNPFTRTL